MSRIRVMMRLKADESYEIRVNEELKEQILVTGIEIRRD
ncbi:hypothetical protein VCHA52P454_270013 [Vibrio chagasii]|nr:hypothetical protein VCHA52P454_270013 [Vibrio chagasii]